MTKIEAPFEGEKYSVTENKYDKNGNIIKVIQNVDNNKNSVTQNQYNAMGLLEKVTLSDGTVTDEKNISKYFYNNAGVQIKMYTGMSSENDSTYLTTNYEYDSWLRAVRTTDSTGYNSGTITYDLNGNVLTSTDANGNVTTNTYDALNRVLTSNTVNSSDSSKNVSKSYTYDSMGRITRTVSNGLTTSYAYDSLGRKTEESEYKSGYSTFKGFFYEGVSQYTRQQIVGINNLLMYSYTSYEYDGEMRIVKVKESGVETVSYTYDANGNKKSETLANGVVSTYTYNKANRITNIVNKKGNTDISSYEYSYYLDGSDACKVRSENGIIETTEYEYDGLKRLTQESVAKGNNTDTYSYEYDNYGNRSKMTAAGSENYVTEYNYNNAQGNYIALLQKEVKTVEGEENPLDLNSNVKQTVYTYDANGNQITKTADGKTETNTYDGLNQLIGFTDGETTASYKYNAGGLRYEKTVNGETINHVWDGNKQIVADVIDNQFYEADCYIRGTNLVAKYNFCNGTKSEYTYYTQNAHGDVVNLTDADGEVTKKYTYDAFGVEKDIVDSDTNAFRYCGEYYDKETATVYLRARYYNPTTGRFISRDSFAGRRSDPLSLNLYTYCRNNPIRFIDPSGHITVNSQWDWAYYVAKGDINYEYDGGNGEVAQRAQNILTYSRASADEKVKMKKGTPREIEVPKSVKGTVNGENITLKTQENWFAFQGTEDSIDAETGYFRIVVGPKVLDSNYSDEGRILGDDFEFPVSIDITLVNKKNNKQEVFPCITRSGAKAHTYSYYNAEDGYAEFDIDNGLIQTGIAYPNSTNVEWEGAFFPGNIDGSSIEFAGNKSDLGDFDPNDYKLVKITVYD